MKSFKFGDERTWLSQEPPVQCGGRYRPCTCDCHIYVPGPCIRNDWTAFPCPLLHFCLWGVLELPGYKNTLYLHVLFHGLTSPQQGLNITKQNLFILSYLKKVIFLIVERKPLNDTLHFIESVTTEPYLLGTSYRKWS